MAPHLTSLINGLLAWAQSCNSHPDELLKLQNALFDLFSSMISKRHAIP